MNETCGCCEGIEKITPIAIANRPGLSVLVYRVGTHASFLETMEARLSNLSIPLADLGISSGASNAGDQQLYPLRLLTTRAPYDPAIALLDAWATVADVLTFYQERIANEGYLRTATERRSILELARLVGYTLRPGVSASVYLAYTMEVTSTPTTIAIGNRAQSLPDPGQQPQPFETSDPLYASPQWNNLQPRLTRPQFITQGKADTPGNVDTQRNADIIDTLYLQGAATGLKPNDPVLLIFTDNTDPAANPPGQFVRFVAAVEPQAAQNRTKVTLQDVVTVNTLCRAILQTIQHYLDLPAFCVSAKDPLADEVMTILIPPPGVQPSQSHDLMSDIGRYLNDSSVDVTTVTDRLILALNGGGGTQGLQDIRAQASGAGDAGDASVANWLDGLINDLEKVLNRVIVSKTATGMAKMSFAIVPAWKTRLLVPALQAFGRSPRSSIALDGPPPANSGLGLSLPGLVASLSKPVSQQPANSQNLARSVRQSFSPQSDILPQLLTTLNPALQPTFYPTISNAVVTLPSDLQSALALRVKSTPFGSNAPLRPVTNDKGIVVDHTEWPIAGTTAVEVELRSPVSEKNAVTRITAFSNALARAAFGTLPEALISIKQNEQTLSGQVALDKPNIQTAIGGIPVNISIIVTRLRFVNALSDVEAVDIYIDGQQVAQNLSFGEVGRYVAIEPGVYSLQDTTDSSKHRLKFMKAGSTKPEDEVIFTGDPLTIELTANTLVAAGKDVDSRKLQPLDDNLSPTQTDRARLRFVHASTLGNLTVNFSGEPQPVLVEIGSTSSLDIKAGTYSLTVTPQGDNKVLLTLSNFNLAAGKIYDIFLIDDGTGSLSAQFAQPIEVPGLFPGERFRLLFAFPQQNRKFKVIVAVGGSATVAQPALLIVQVADDGDSDDDDDSLVLTQMFTKAPQTQVNSIAGRNIVINVGENNLPLSISDESLEPVPQDQWNVVALDAKFDQVIPGSWVVIERPDKGKTIISRVVSTQQVAKADYGVTGNVTQLTLDQPWLDDKDVSLATLRQVTVYAQSVAQNLADETIDPVKEAVCGEQVELDAVYNGLHTGRWLIVSGERTDILGASGIQGAELVMLAGVKQAVHQVLVSGSVATSDANTIDLPGDKTHTFLTLANALAYSYKRDTVTIYGNVVRATHGQTQGEVLGSGDGSKMLQQFALRQSPLTYLSAPTPAGAASTLKVYVNNIEWHEVDSLASLGPSDHEFITQTDDDAKTSVIFGNGQHGARLPTGVENVTATYRTGIGKPGNVHARQISLLATRPLGVKGVINPLPASGGADKESRDQARRNVPVAVLALDRLVSVQDYADFARTYAGIGKASARAIPNGRRQLVHLTIAGADNIPIDIDSDLYRNLYQALRQSGDPNVPLQVAVCEVLLLLIQARVHILPDYQWEFVESTLRAALLDAFSFEQRELGQPVFQSEVISVMQGVAGVDYVDLEIMGAIGQSTLLSAVRKLAGKNPPDPQDPSEPFEPSETEANELLELLNLTDHNDVFVNLAEFNPTTDDPNNINPAQLVFLSPDVPDTLILTELTDA